jgi:hypothetical protein
MLNLILRSYSTLHRGWYVVNAYRGSTLCTEFTFTHTHSHSHSHSHTHTHTHSHSHSHSHTLALSLSGNWFSFNKGTVFLTSNFDSVVSVYIYEAWMRYCGVFQLGCFQLPAWMLLHFWKSFLIIHLTSVLNWLLKRMNILCCHWKSRVRPNSLQPPGTAWAQCADLSVTHPFVTWWYSGRSFACAALARASMERTVRLVGDMARRVPPPARRGRLRHTNWVGGPLPAPEASNNTGVRHPKCSVASSLTNRATDWLTDWLDELLAEWLID